MKPRLIVILQWIKLASLIMLSTSRIGQTENPFHSRGVVKNANPNTNSSDPNTIQIYSKQNTNLLLDCAVNINFSNSIWLKDGQRVSSILRDNTNNKRVIGHRFLVESNGSLFIENVRLEDDGKWQCEAEDPFGYVVTAKPIRLTVLEAPKRVYLMIDNRILDPGNPFIPVRENSDLKISCVVDEGNPKPSLNWELRLSSLTVMDALEVPLDILNLTETMCDQEIGARNDALLGKVLRSHHNAVLTCYVHHIALEQPLNMSVLLNVQYTPSFSISREPGFGIPIREGMPVSLKCDVDANPKARPIWKKDDSEPPVQQTQEGFLNFTAIHREHSGWYKCVAKHQLGMFSSAGYFLNVRFETDVTQEPEFDVGELSSTGRRLEVALGGTVQLSCPAGTTGCWTRVQQSTHSLEPMGASKELRLDKILYQEAGEYRCVAPKQDQTQKLDILRSALPVEVVVTGQPSVNPASKNVTAEYDQPLTLTMEFCANPLFNRVFWIAKDKVYRPGDADKAIIAYSIKNSSYPNCYQAVLFLTKVTKAQIGEYIFIVRSPNGLAEGNFMVNVSKANYSVQEDIKSIGTTQLCHFASICILVNILISIKSFHYDIFS